MARVSGANGLYGVKGDVRARVWQRMGRTRPNSSPRVRIALEPRVRHVAPGGRVRFRLHVQNPAPFDRRVVIRLQDPDDPWRASLPLRDVRVPGQSAVTLFLRVDVPAGAAPGDRQTFQVLAAGFDEAERPARLDVEAVVVPAPQSASTPVSVA